MLPRAYVLWVIPLFLGALLVKVVLVRILRRHVRAVEIGDRWWGWAAVAAVLVGLVVVQPLLGILVTLGFAVALTGASAVGSPFRPRWGRPRR